MGVLERFNTSTSHKQFKCNKSVWIKFDLKFDQGAQADIGGYRPIGFYRNLFSKSALRITSLICKMNLYMEMQTGCSATILYFLT